MGSFTQSWIQSLTAAADNPNARKVKPSLELVNRLVRNPELEDRPVAAKDLWDYAESNHLRELISLLPALQSRWEFERDDTFIFSQPTSGQVTTFEQWSEQLGVVPSDFALQAEVNGTEWATLIREQAVQKQKAYSQTTLGNQTLSLSCTANWSGKAWEIRFESPDWFTVDYADAVTVERIGANTIDEVALEAIAKAESALSRDKTIPKSAEKQTSWTDCVPQVEDLLTKILGSSELSERTKMIVCCVWPTVYREENMLAGKADIDWLRPIMADCLKASPQLTIWMFVYAKLLFQLHRGYGLGFCADFGLD